jgi:hypothetical protein
MSRSFVDRTPLVALGATLLALGLLFVGALQERKLLRESLVVSEEGVVTEPFQLEARTFGALRIDGRVTVPSNTWAAVRLAIVDAEGETIAEAVKETWSESGVWHEDGQSGTWEESDTELAWDVRPDSPEQVKIELELLGMGTTDDLSELEGQAVNVFLTVHDGVVDFRWLAMGLIGTALLFVLVWYAAGHGGRPVVVERSDGEITARADCVGELVAITVSGLLDETSYVASLYLTVRDSNGMEIVNLDEDLLLTEVRSDGDLEGFRFNRKLYLLLPPGSYGFYVRVTPDAPIEWVKLLVRDSATTRSAVDIHPLAAPSAAPFEESGS